MYLFIDIKTQGSPKNVCKPLINYDLFDISITEIAWLLVDDKKKVVDKQHFKALNKGFVNYQDYEKYSKSSESSITKHYSFSHVLENWLKGSLEKAELIIYYDISLKDNLIDNLYGFELSEHENPLLTKDRLCILEETQDQFKQENKNITPSLASLYYQLFEKDLPKIENLDISVETLSKCFFKLKEDKCLSLAKRRKYHPEIKTPNGLLPAKIKSIKGTTYKISSNEKVQNKQPVRNSYLIANHFKNYGEVVEIKNFNANGILTSWVEYIFMSSALKYAKLFSSKKGLLKTKQYEYNNEGNLSSINYFNGEMNLLGTKNYSYDDNGNLLNIFFNKTDCTLAITNFRYNGLGGLYIESCHISDENLDKEHSKVDCKGNIIETFKYNYIDSSTGVALSNKYRYNGHGLLIEKNFVKVVGEDCNPLTEKNYKFDYKYDENGNWIRRIEHIDSKPCYMEIREIEYINS